MPPDYNVGYVFGLSAIPFVMNIIFLIASLILYKISIQNRKFNGIQILPDLLEGDHKRVFFGKIDSINKKVKSNFILIAVINFIFLLLIIVYAFILAPLILENIIEEKKFEIFVDLTFILLKTTPILFILYGLTIPHSPIIRPAWIAVFENENLDIFSLKRSKNPFLKKFWKERYFSNLLFIYVRTFIKDYYQEKQYYHSKFSKDLVKFHNFILKDKDQPYRGLRSFLQYIQNRSIHVLYFSELKMIKARPQTKYHPASIGGTVLLTLGFFNFMYTFFYLELFFEFKFSIITLIFGIILVMYGDYKLIYLNHEILHSILLNYNIEDASDECDSIVQLMDKEFPYMHFKS